MAENAGQSIPPASSTERLYTVREGCERLHVGNTKIWELISNGHLETVRLGGRCRRIRGTSLDRLVENGIPG